MKFSTFFDYHFWKIAVDVWNIKKCHQWPNLSIFNKKNQLFISNGSGVIHFLMKLCNPVLLGIRWHKSKTMTDKCWQKDVLNSKFNAEFKFEIKIGPFH
jgi:hypothetical protein